MNAARNEGTERLARDLMGWGPLATNEPTDMWWDVKAGHAWHGYATKTSREARGVTAHPYLFAPFTDANHDFMVLERARELWNDKREEIVMDDALRAVAADMPYHVRLGYRVGDYARAALTVLEFIDSHAECEIADNG
jgi:hypothetical protein